MMWFSKKRMKLEMLKLEWRNRLPCTYDNGEFDKSDFILKKISCRWEYVLVEVVQGMLLKGNPVNVTDFLFRMLM
ncbi:hypothetical protein DPMN_040153 [Dreissena polymorpha]|uniref:Uncharacterized protein n=1 Tax=Dreissena polymorpha TaxID=45954 RepID=A0A9D4HUY2_DREPO|nr:hypothetical protein DPMN_040153 [Dreissena polymorpha]